MTILGGKNTIFLNTLYLTSFFSFPPSENLKGILEKVKAKKATAQESFSYKSTTYRLLAS